MCLLTAVSVGCHWKRHHAELAPGPAGHRVRRVQTCTRWPLPAAWTPSGRCLGATWQHSCSRLSWRWAGHLTLQPGWMRPWPSPWRCAAAGAATAAAAATCPHTDSAPCCTRVAALLHPPRSTVCGKPLIKLALTLGRLGILLFWQCYKACHARGCFGYCDCTRPAARMRAGLCEQPYIRGAQEPSAAVHQRPPRGMRPSQTLHRIGVCGAQSKSQQAMGIPGVWPQLRR